MDITVADRNSDADALASLFGRNLTAEYISHSELQGPRALRPGQWNPDVGGILRTEIKARLHEPLSAFPHGANWQGVIEAHDGGVLVGLAFVTITADAPVPFGTIEDIVVEQARRGAGLGEQMMRWIIERLEQAGIKRSFLESGIGNESAHHLFERLGFKTVSIVMMRDG